MTVAACLLELGGIATRHELLALCGRAAVDRALRSGAIVALARGRYALAVVDAGVRAAHALSGVLCLESAAMHHGWEVLRVPELPQVLVARNRRIRPDRLAAVDLHRGTLTADDVSGVATGVERTLTQCFRSLDLDSALAVGDSALRHGMTPSTMRRVAQEVLGPGSPRVRRVAAAASPDAANAFESALRAIAMDVPDLDVRPQRLITGPHQQVRADLVDVEKRIVLEADSFTWHGDRAALRRDCRRYDLLVVDGWLVLRFA